MSEAKKRTDALHNLLDFKEALEERIDRWMDVKSALESAYNAVVQNRRAIFESQKQWDELKTDAMCTVLACLTGGLGNAARFKKIVGSSELLEDVLQAGLQGLGQGVIKRVERSDSDLTNPYCEPALWLEQTIRDYRRELRQCFRRANERIKNISASELAAFDPVKQQNLYKQFINSLNAHAPVPKANASTLTIELEELLWAKWIVRRCSPTISGPEMSCIPATHFPGEEIFKTTKTLLPWAGYEVRNIPHHHLVDPGAKLENHFDRAGISAKAGIKNGIGFRCSDEETIKLVTWARQRSQRGLSIKVVTLAEYYAKVRKQVTDELKDILRNQYAAMRMFFAGWNPQAEAVYANLLAGVERM